MANELEKNNLKLADIIDVDFLQHFQDAFAKTANIACITVDSTGPITKPSNFTDFCFKHTRETELGYKRCNECDIKYGQLAAEKGEPVIYTCHSGLTDFAVPIMLKGKQIGAVLGGQVLTKKPDEVHFRKIAQELGIDEEEYINALQKIKIIPYEQIKASADLLFISANSISNIAEKNFELLKKNRQEIERTAQESLLRRITENIRGSFDINTILSYICDELAKVFNVQRATIIKYHDNNDFSNFEVLREYRENPQIIGILNNSDFNFKVGDIWAKVLEEDNFLSVSNIQESNMPEFFKDNYQKMGQKSILIAPIQEGKVKWGVIVLSEYNYYREWSLEDKKLLRIISDQIYLALKQSELYSKMQEQVEREKAILNNIPFLAWLKDKNGKYLNANGAYAKFCNSTIANLVGNTAFEIFPQELAEKYTEDDLNIINSKKQSNIETEIETPDGKRWYEIFKNPIYDDENNVIGLAGFARDITEKRELDKMKDEFVSIISHELRTPLTSIRGSLGLVLGNTLGVLPEKVSTLLNIANNNTIRLVNLINDILDLEKIKAGKMDFIFAEHNVSDLVNESITLNEEYAKQYNVQFKIKNTIPDIFINVDKSRFIQVLTNLLSNAAKFSYQNGIVYISTERCKNRIRVSVTNKGNGIPEKSFSKIFQSFSQVDSSDSRRSGGTGLGLSICKSIVEKMGGVIDFISKLKDDTIFYFEFPEITQNDALKTVLICEDNKTTAFSIKSKLESLNYKTNIAYTIQEARQMLNENHYDLMTLDLLLPDGNGLELLEDLKFNKKNKNLPVVIVSVKKPDLKLIKNEHHVINWVEKSFNMEDFEKTINDLLKDKNNVEILHIENDKDLLKLIELTLSDIAHITSISTLGEAKKIIMENVFDLIILDYVFPDGTSDKLIPLIKGGINKNAKLIVFSAYEESKVITKYVDDIILKTNVSNEVFKSCIQQQLIKKEFKETL